MSFSLLCTSENCKVNTRFVEMNWGESFKGLQMSDWDLTVLVKVSERCGENFDEVSSILKYVQSPKPSTSVLTQSCTPALVHWLF